MDQLWSNRYHTNCPYGNNNKLTSRSHIKRIPVISMTRVVVPIYTRMIVVINPLKKPNSQSHCPYDNKNNNIPPLRSRLQPRDVVLSVEVNTARRVPSARCLFSLYVEIHEGLQRRENSGKTELEVMHLSIRRCTRVRWWRDDVVDHVRDVVALLENRGESRGMVDIRHRRVFRVYGFAQPPPRIVDHVPDGLDPAQTVDLILHGSFQCPNMDDVCLVSTIPRMEARVWQRQRSLNLPSSHLQGR